MRLRAYPVAFAAVFAAWVAIQVPPLHAEDGSAAWLRYAAIPHAVRYANLPSHIIVLGDSPSDKAAASELQRGLSSMLGRPFTVEVAPRSIDEKRDAIVVASANELDRLPARDRKSDGVR